MPTEFLLMLLTVIHESLVGQLSTKDAVLTTLTNNFSHEDQKLLKTWIFSEILAKFVPLHMQKRVFWIPFLTHIVINLLDAGIPAHLDVLVCLQKCSQFILYSFLAHGRRKISRQFCASFSNIVVKCDWNCKNSHNVD